MNRCIRPSFLVIFATLALLGVACTFGGCNYEAPPPSAGAGGDYQPGPMLEPTSSSSGSGSNPLLEGTNSGEKNKVILDNVVTLIDGASLAPGGQHFEIATKNLNQYFANPNPADYAMSADAREFVAKEMPEDTLKRRRLTPEGMVKVLEVPRFEMPDCRHLEDCMFYSRIARRVAGSGDDLTRVRRVFDWTVKQITLVPPGSLSTPKLFQAKARPFDVLLRGMGTEDGVGWAERGWLFMSLCRQLGLDCALITYTPTDESTENDKAPAKEKEKEKAKPQPIPWICAVLIEGKPYLFDARIGMAIPGPDGTGVATLEEAMTDDRVLARLQLPGQSDYHTTRKVLVDSPTKIGVLIDSSPGYLSPRMQVLQRELSGRDRTILFRDPVEQSQKFADALGSRYGGTKFWDMPITVYTLLFTSADFTEATLLSIALFDPRLPLVYARVKQLRGEISEAVSEYVSMRFAENAMLKVALPKNVNPAQKDRFRISPEDQRALDMYSTYFLGLCHLEQNHPEQAEFFFRETLKLLPAPGPGQNYYNMFRWGAESNLGRILEARGDYLHATAYYSEMVPTPQHHGDLLRARDLIWRNPLAPVPAPLPIPPPSDAGIPVGGR